MSREGFAEESDMRGEEDKKRIREISKIRKEQAAEEHKAAQEKEEKRVQGLTDTFTKLGFKAVKPSHNDYLLERNDSLFNASEDGQIITFSGKNFAQKELGK